MYLTTLQPLLCAIITNLLIIYVDCQLAAWTSVYENQLIRSPEPGWARFCLGSEVYDVFANQCPGGVFWDESTNNQWECVCTRGAWRRSAGWCTGENTQRFTQGDITCFEPHSEEKPGLHAMYYVGDRFSAWDSSLPILLTDFNAGIPIRKGEFSRPWQISSRSKKNPRVLIYRPREDWTAEDTTSNITKLCLRAPDSFDEDTEGLFIYSAAKLFDASGGAQKFQLKYTRGCQSWNAHDGVEWIDVVGENLQQKNMIVPTYNPQSASAKCSKCIANPIRAAPETDIDGGPLQEREEFTVFDLRNVAVLKTEIDLQTYRLGEYWAHRVLRNGSDYLVGEIQEIEILTKAALMSYQVCDKALVPFQFYQYFLLMFKMLLSESFKKYPPKGAIGEDYYAQINTILDDCRGNRSEIKFETNGTCPPVIQEFSSGGHHQSIDTKSDYSSDKGRHDFLLEFIWRLKSFMHYKCFNEFQSNSILHDILQHQLESLFTEDIIIRWYNPGHSFQMYHMIFESHFDLEVAMSNFQRCIVATHDAVKYPVWLKRPIDRPEIMPKKGGTNRFKRSLGHGSQSPPSNVVRRKRDADDDYSGEEEGEENKAPNNLFENKAACIKSIRTFMSESNRVSDPQCW